MVEQIYLGAKPMHKVKSDVEFVLERNTCCATKPSKTKGMMPIREYTHSELGETKMLTFFFLTVKTIKYGK